MKLATRIVLAIAAIIGALAVAGGGFAYYRLRASLPVLEGNVVVDALAHSVHIERDVDGVPRISATDRADAAFGLGFLHAQERFFQMDLMRRAAAGELAELFGRPVIGIDRGFRLHRFRELSRRGVVKLEDRDRKLVESYCAGVNAGLAALSRPPIEYLLASTTPVAWRSEDTLLVVYYMYLLLQDSRAEQDYQLYLLHDVLPRPVADFLTPIGDPDWDAPLTGGRLQPVATPGPDIFDLRHVATRRQAWPIDSANQFRGSNSWALAGTHTASKGALVANDMHLNFGIPNVFYRASLEIGAHSEALRRLNGVTLPGFPFLIAGSNGAVAWGLANSAADTVDLVRLDQTDLPASAYRTPGQVEQIETKREVIHVRGEPDEMLDIGLTRWGPIIRDSPSGARFAQLWVAHDPGAADLGLSRLESASSTAEAIALVARAGIPALSLIVGDRDGRIGWTVAGPLPRRVEGDGRLPLLSSTTEVGWSGWLDPDDYPRVTGGTIDRLWAANARPVDGDELRKLGYGFYLSGARAGAIRDGIAHFDTASEADMLRQQLDDRAPLLGRWRDLLLKVLSRPGTPNSQRRLEMQRLVEQWNGRASAESAGYRLLREFRDATEQLVFEPFVAIVVAKHPDFSYSRITDQREAPLWRLLSEQPTHLLSSRFRDWDELLDAAVDKTLEPTAGRALASYRWGERNRLQMRHPMSPFFPPLGVLSDMKPVEIDGDLNVPLAQNASHGPVMRLVVSPGHDEHGILTMPGGQAGNPLSPYYGAGQSDWLQGRPAPLLPGPARYRLHLLPAAS